ncbi:hypothetical protein [Aidingimonas halophila]|nr:hypothetical protein [Aidingimonas halophila]GHC30759.1 hypothetical protein GCM10008094_23970 [Aidingimonas halophila]
MRYQKFNKPMDEREKLRKFRELDDAFAEALKELDGGSGYDTPPQEDAASLEARRQEEEIERQRLFEQRLRALMSEYHLPSESVSTLMRTLLELGRIA